jgi:peptidyl-prolyl cis-trans isomerase D
MLSLIRRLTHSKVGLVVTFGLLALIALAFAATDITGMQSGATAGGGSVATVGKAKIGEGELRDRAQNVLEGYRQQQPGIDMGQFIAQGGLEGTLNQLIEDLALDQFGRDQGMVVSKRAVDGEIASIPALQGPDGKFSQTIYQQLLRDRKLTDVQIRQDIARDIIKQQLILPTLPAAQVPLQLALPYASLLLEKRQGQVGFIPTRAMPVGAAPTEAELATWYKRNLAHYTIPERRTIRYAMVTGDQIKAQTVPSEAEIAQAYKSQAATYAATEKRSIVQVILADQASANALAAKVKAGTSIEAAARAAGLEPITLPLVQKAAYAAQSTPAIADAVFAAPQGGVVGPLRGTLGFTVVRVDAIQKVAARSLDEVRGEVSAAVSREKANTVLARIHDALDDGIANRSTFAELVSDQKLTASATPALLADGRDPNDATRKAAPDFMPIIAAAFAAESGDSPQLVTIGTDGGFALVALDRVVPPAAPPIAAIRPVLARDFTLDRSRRAARAIAAGIVAKANKGGAFPALYAASGVKVPPIQPLNASRAQLSTNPRGAPPPLVLMFSMSQGTSKLLEAPNNEGWFVLHLDRIERGNAVGKPQVIDAMRADLGKVVGREYAQQFSVAVQKHVGVKKNDKSIAAVRAALTGAGAAQ